MREKRCIATLFFIIYTFCYLQTLPLSVRQVKTAIIPFLLFIKTTFNGLTLLLPSKASFDGAQKKPSGKPAVKFEASEKFFLSPEKNS